MDNKNQINYKEILEELNENEQVEYSISPELINKFRRLGDYDSKSGLIGVCYFLGTFVWQLRMSFDFLVRPFVSEHYQIKTDRDKAVLKLCHLLLKHTKQLITDYDNTVMKILDYKGK